MANNDTMKSDDKHKERAKQDVRNAETRIRVQQRNVEGATSRRPFAPQPGYSYVDGGCRRYSPAKPGATMREVYAGMAMQGILARSAPDSISCDAVIKTSVRYADALCKVLEDTTPVGEAVDAAIIRTAVDEGHPFVSTVETIRAAEDHDHTLDCPYCGGSGHAADAKLPMMQIDMKTGEVTSVSPWRPAEEAPKDGTSIIALYDVASDHYGLDIVWFDKMLGWTTDCIDPLGYELELWAPIPPLPQKEGE